MHTCGSNTVDGVLVPSGKKRENHMRRFLTITVILFVGVFQSLYAQVPLPATASFDVGFSPGGTALAVVEKAIASSKSEILMACYEFTLS